jgi:hypothetical protein
VILQKNGMMSFKNKHYGLPKTIADHREVQCEAVFCFWIFKRHGHFTNSAGYLSLPAYWLRIHGLG